MHLALALVLCFGASCAQAPSEAGGEVDDFDEVAPPHTAVVDAGGADPDARDAAAVDAAVEMDAGPTKGAADASGADAHADAHTSEPPEPDASGTDADANADAGDNGDGADGGADADAGPDGEDPSDAGPLVDAAPFAPDAANRDAASPPDSSVPPEEAPCPPGVYAGAFAGEISALLGFVRIDISGTISVEIAAPSDGSREDMLPIRNGKLEGTDQDGNPIRAVVTGTLNCERRRLEAGRIIEGAYRRPDPLVPFAPPTTTRFSGTITATYSDDPPSVQGRWEVENESGRRGGTGSLSVTLRP